MGLSQDELAEKVFVTRQAVSRWENGESLTDVILKEKQRRPRATPHKDILKTPD